MVGSAIKRILVKKGYKNLLCPSRKELNLLNFDKVEIGLKIINLMLLFLLQLKLEEYMQTLNLQLILFSKI